ncbi:mammalian ependymin-related protein 1-like [Physella acuta]|uniref:mammalian ependymin-related protein 1-like n=1 Tax=Physella acuta TaxID=109671 RepID=UPI0027DB98B9|nr:mammalian ependymin-related protein 1-like [Physella acuta]
MWRYSDHPSFFGPLYPTGSGTKPGVVGLLVTQLSDRTQRPDDMKILLLLAALIGICLAARPCSAPWELTFRASRHDQADTYYRRYYVEYDRPNQRVAMFEESFSGGTREIREFLFLHYIDTGFEYDFRLKNCTRFRTGPFRPFEVPYNSTYEGSFQVGGPGEDFTVDSWSDRIPTRRENWLGEFSLRNCYPISQFLVDTTNFNRTSISHFFDTVQGIVNPNDFDVPTECTRLPPDSFAPISEQALRARAMYAGTFDL